MSDNLQAIFYDMLQQFGVRGVQIREVLGLDEELIDLLPWVRLFLMRIGNS